MPQGMLTAFYSRDLICVSYEKVQPDGKGKKKKKEGEEKRETATQHATETLFFPSISFMKLVLESVEKRDFLETSLWEGREV